MNTGYRIYVEKKTAFQVEANSLKEELNENLSLNLKNLRLLNVYDLFGEKPIYGFWRSGYGLCNGLCDKGHGSQG